ncbi:hypothetical protein BGX26_005260, partial [Mortierella sp. AD094]
HENHRQRQATGLRQSLIPFPAAKGNQRKAAPLKRKLEDDAVDCLQSAHIPATKTNAEEPAKKRGRPRKAKEVTDAVDTAHTTGTADRTKLSNASPTASALAAEHLPAENHKRPCKTNHTSDTVDAIDSPESTSPRTPAPTARRTANVSSNKKLRQSSRKRNAIYPPESISSHTPVPAVKRTANVSSNKKLRQSSGKLNATNALKPLFTLTPATRNSKKAHLKNTDALEARTRREISTPLNMCENLQVAQYLKCKACLGEVTSRKSKACRTLCRIQREKRNLVTWIVESIPTTSHAVQVDGLGIIDEAPWNRSLADTILSLDQSEDSPLIEDEFDGVFPPYSQVPMSPILADSVSPTLSQEGHCDVPHFPGDAGPVDSTSSGAICRDSLSPLNQLDEEPYFDPSQLKHITYLPFGLRWREFDPKTPMSADFVNSVSSILSQDDRLGVPLSRFLKCDNIEESGLLSCDVCLGHTTSSKAMCRSQFLAHQGHLKYLLRVALCRSNAEDVDRGGWPYRPDPECHGYVDPVGIHEFDVCAPTEDSGCALCLDDPDEFLHCEGRLEKYRKYLKIMYPEKFRIFNYTVGYYRRVERAEKLAKSLHLAEGKGLHDDVVRISAQVNELNAQLRADEDRIRALHEEYDARINAQVPYNGGGSVPKLNTIGKFLTRLDEIFENLDQDFADELMDKYGLNAVQSIPEDQFEDLDLPNIQSIFDDDFENISTDDDFENISTDDEGDFHSSYMLVKIRSTPEDDNTDDGSDSES